MAKEGSLAEWSTGVCDCFSDGGSCCLTFWCPCITFGRVAEFADRGGIGCCVHGSLCCFMSVFLIHLAPAVYAWIYRIKFRRTYNIDGDECADCLLTFFCFNCSLCQQYRELKSRGYNPSAGWAANKHLQSGGATTAPTFDGGMTR